MKKINFEVVSTRCIGFIRCSTSRGKPPAPAAGAGADVSSPTPPTTVTAFTTTESEMKKPSCTSSSYRVWATHSFGHSMERTRILCNLNSLLTCRKLPWLTVDQRMSVLLRGFKSEARRQIGTSKIALWKRLALVGSVGSLMAYGYYSANRDMEIKKEHVRYEELKKAELGGDWTLTDHHGKERSSTEFRGQWILMYFGFTHCPDICPEELEKLVNIVKAFDDNPKLPSMMPIFVTLDPDRDNPARIKDYLAEFKCPRLLGFTAESESTIREMATRYRAYFSKGIPDEDNDYIVDHTIIIYVINPKGEFVNYFDRGRSAKQIINTVTDHIHKFDELQEKGL